MPADAHLVFDRPRLKSGVTPSPEWTDAEVLGLVEMVATALLGADWRASLREISIPVASALDAWGRAVTTPSTPQPTLAIARVRLQAATSAARAVERERRMAEHVLTTKEEAPDGHEDA